VIWVNGFGLSVNIISATPNPREYDRADAVRPQDPPRDRQRIKRRRVLEGGLEQRKLIDDQKEQRQESVGALEELECRHGRRDAHDTDQEPGQDIFVESSEEHPVQCVGGTSAIADKLVVSERLGKSEFMIVGHRRDRRFAFRDRWTD
jgi:hypothetical protein